MHPFLLMHVRCFIHLSCMLTKIQWVTTGTRAIRALRARRMYLFTQSTLKISRSGLLKYERRHLVVSRNVVGRCFEVEDAYIHIPTASCCRVKYYVK